MKHFLIPALFLLTACEGQNPQWAAIADVPQHILTAMTEQPQWLKDERAANDSVFRIERWKPAAREEAAAAAPAQVAAKPVKAKKPKAETLVDASKAVPVPVVEAKPLLQLASASARIPVPATKNASPEPHIVVIEEYDAATGEQCRRYGYYEDRSQPGQLRTACRANAKSEWVDLRAMTHQTLSPLATLPPIGTAMVVDPE